MLFATAGQASVFLATVYAGLALGVVYDVLALLRAVLGGKRLVNALFDVLFCACALGSVIITAVASNGGLFHTYMLLGHLCGFLLYRITLARVTHFIARMVLRALKWMGGKMAKTALGKKFLK